MNAHVPVREVARGRWRGILPALGVDPVFLTGKQGPCPLCGGKTRFRFDDRDGTGSWICNHDGAGDGLALVMAKLGLSFRDAAQRVEELAGDAPRVASRPQQSDEQRRAAMNHLWMGSRAVEAGDPVDLWLQGRVGGWPATRSLRTCARCRHQDGETVSWHPAMVAMVTDADGKPATLHRTYLTAGGRKAPVSEVRKTMAGHIPDGSAVRLAEAGRVLGIAEGIETALAASKLFSVPVWAALNEVILAKWVPPAGVSEAIVFADHDANYVGQSSAFALARRLCNRGLTVRVEVPPEPDTDWNDHLLGRAA